MSQKGAFIVFEGPDGSSKTTQAKLLGQWLTNQNIPFLHTREPDGIFRKVVLDPNHEGEFHPYTDVLLFAASRINKYKMVIEPAVNNGKIVICDRYVESSIVYQGIASGVNPEHIQSVHDTFIRDNRLTIVLHIPAEVSVSRIAGRNEEKDRMEHRTMDYHKKVSEGYLTLVDKFSHIHLVDATQTMEQIHEDVLKIIIPHLAERGYNIGCP